MTMRVRANDGTHTATIDVAYDASFFAVPTSSGLILSTVPVRIPKDAVSGTVTFCISDTDEDCLLVPGAANECAVNSLTPMGL